MKHDFVYKISIAILKGQYSYADYVQMIVNCFLIHLQFFLKCILASCSPEPFKALLFSHLHVPYIHSPSHAMKYIASKYNLSNF